MATFSMTTDLEKIFPIISIQGEIDLHTCPQLHQRLTEFIAEGHSTLILDLDHVSYIDSTGLGVVAHAARQLGELGVIRVACAKPQVLKILELSGLTRKNFEVYPTKSAALGTPGQA